MKVPGNMLLTITIVPTVRSDVVVQVLQVDRTGDRWFRSAAINE